MGRALPGVGSDILECDYQRERVGSIGYARNVSAAGIDGNTPVPVVYAQGNDEHDSTWQRNVLRGMMAGEARLELPPGEHVLKVYGIDSSVVLDRVIVELED